VFSNQSPVGTGVGFAGWPVEVRGPPDGLGRSHVEGHMTPGGIDEKAVGFVAPLAGDFDAVAVASGRGLVWKREFGGGFGS